MPASGGRLGVNEPPPAATTTTLARNCVPASVTSRKRPSSVRCRASMRWLRWNVAPNGLICCQQPVGQLLARHDRQARNVVDRLLRIELGALAADLVEDVDDVRLDVDETELEHGEQPDRPCADDQGIGFDRRVPRSLQAWVTLALVARCQNCFSGTRTTRPSSACVTLIWQAAGLRGARRRRSRACPPPSPRARRPSRARPRRHRRGTSRMRRRLPHSASMPSIRFFLAVSMTVMPGSASTVCAVPSGWMIGDFGHDGSGFGLPCGLPMPSGSAPMRMRPARAEC